MWTLDKPMASLSAAISTVAWQSCSILLNVPSSFGHPLFAVLIGWERNNVYQILDSNNQQFLTAKEGKGVTGNIGGFQLHLIFVPLLFDDLPSCEQSYTSSLGSPLLDLL